jgi:hypothetical protein
MGRQAHLRLDDPLATSVRLTKSAEILDAYAHTVFASQAENRSPGELDAS